MIFKATGWGFNTTMLRIVVEEHCWDQLTVELFLSFEWIVKSFFHEDGWIESMTKLDHFREVTSVFCELSLSVVHFFAKSKFGKLTICSHHSLLTKSSPTSQPHRQWLEFGLTWLRDHFFVKFLMSLNDFLSKMGNEWSAIGEAQHNPGGDWCWLPCNLGRVQLSPLRFWTHFGCLFTSSHRIIYWPPSGYVEFQLTI